MITVGKWGGEYPEKNTPVRLLAIEEFTCLEALVLRSLMFHKKNTQGGDKHCEVTMNFK